METHNYEWVNDKMTYWPILKTIYARNLHV